MRKTSVTLCFDQCRRSVQEVSERKCQRNKNLDPGNQCITGKVFLDAVNSEKERKRREKEEKDEKKKERARLAEEKKRKLDERKEKKVKKVKKKVNKKIQGCSRPLPGGAICLYTYQLWYTLRS